MSVATKKARVAPKGGGAWDQRLFAVLKKLGHVELGMKLDQVEIDCDGGNGYEDGQICEVRVHMSDKDGYEDSEYIIDFNMTEFPSSCGVLVVHELPNSLAPDLYPFFFDIVNAAAHKMRYGLVMISHRKGENVLKAAEAAGFHETDTCHNPNSGNTITLMSKVVTAPTQKSLIEAVVNVMR